MSNPDVLNAAPLTRVPSRSPHPPKTDKFSKVSQVRETQPTVTSANVVTGNTVSQRFAGDSGATATAQINPITGQLEIRGNVPIINEETIKNIFTRDENTPVVGAPNEFNQTVDPQKDTSGEKSASDTSAYFA